MTSRIVILLALAFLFGCSSSQEDYVIASRVGTYLGGTGVIPLDTREADRAHSGKIVYVGPGINGSPHFTYYEVTSRDDMQKLKSAAEQALRQIPEAKKITLRFMERQVFHQSSDGSGYRGKEKEIEAIVIERAR
jgi:hypothetical protein